MRRALVLFLLLATSASADEARLRALLAQLDYEGVATAFESAPSQSVVERALYVGALARFGAMGRARAEAAKLREEHPQSAWSWYAIASAAARSPAEAVIASAKMIELAGDAPDEEMIRARARALMDAQKFNEALAFLDSRHRNARAMILVRQSGPKVDPSVYDLLDQQDLEAIFLEGLFLAFETRFAEALPYLEKAATMTPSARVHLEHWNTLRALESDQLETAIDAAVERYGTPPLLLNAAITYERAGKMEKATELENRILREAPESMSAQFVLQQRYLRLTNDKAAMAARLREFLIYPHHYEPSLRTNAYLDLADPDVLAAFGKDAEKFAREAQAAIEKMYPDKERAAPRLAAMHDALGWVLFQRGKKSAAAKELLAAWELNQKYAKPAPRAPMESRKKQALASRTSKPVPPFTLKTLDGKSVAASDLKGKIAVINFWGIWCPGCVREMPELQKLVKKYAKDEKVAILTINTDYDAGRVRRWMREKKYDFGVLVDDRYAHKVVKVYPTTWFLDPEGRIAFEKNGWSEDLVEEFSWRIEALR